MSRLPQIFTGLAAIVVFCIGLFACVTVGRPRLATVPFVDLGRYVGKWYEIASYPAFFQRDCSATTAEYTALPDGRIRVVNAAWKKGAPVRVEGTAKVVVGSGNAKLKVRFGALISGDYWVIALDQKSYQWAVVGHPSRNFLWILCREPRMDPALYHRILGDIRTAGYDPARVVLNDQTRNLADVSAPK